MNALVSPDEFRTPAEDAFTDAMQALSKLYSLASDANIESLKQRTEAAVRELIGWHHERPRTELLDEEPCRVIRNKTLVNFPPPQQQEQETR